MPDGPHALKGIAQYKDGSQRVAEIPVLLDRRFKDPQRVPDSRAAITFAGRGTVGEKFKLERDGQRGDTELHVQSTQGLQVGDYLFIDGPATDRWKKLTQNACLWGSYRNYEIVVTGVTDRSISLGQPLRIEFPIVDGSYVQKVSPIQRCGIEDLYLEQTENLWITSVLFSNGWNCWARGVTVKKCGRFPVYGSAAKWCEIRDCVFDDAWFKGGGGTAYTGWDRCWDCLMENVETFKLRHAPLFQWAASGCVIRKSIFHESDAQWHAGWTNENLIEQCTVESVQGNGGYGYGMWASPPEDTRPRPQRPAKRRLQLRCQLPEGRGLDGRHERKLADPVQPLRRGQRSGRFRQDVQFRPYHPRKRLCLEGRQVGHDPSGHRRLHGDRGKRQLPVWREWPFRVRPDPIAVVRGKPGFVSLPQAQDRNPPCRQSTSGNGSIAQNDDFLCNNEVTRPPSGGDNVRVGRVL